ncbi:MAG TPA: metal-dependent hydrolase [Acidimicrobiales bacterium]|nr:metal-dependent hydrolase [Acidimicrobiales bacterium]
MAILELNRDRRPVAPRRTAFDLASTPVHWLAQDAQATHTMNVGNLLFPTGERFFNDSLRNALPYVDDERLRTEIKGFLGQEVTHGNEHERCVARMREHGINFDRELRVFERFRQILDRGVRRLPEPLRRQAVLQMLAVTAAAEHFTASLAGYVLADNTWDESASEDDAVDLWLWHAAEEIEHRHVAFDVYAYVGGGYLRRVLTMVPLAVGLPVVWPLLTSEILRRDPSAKGRWRWRKHIASARRGEVFSLPRALWDVRLYFQPGHHPSHLPGSLEIALRHLETAPRVLGHRGARRRAARP